MSGVTWKEIERPYGRRYAAMVGRVCVGIVGYSACVTKEDPLIYYADCALPQAKPLPRFLTVDEAKLALEGRVAAWFVACGC